MACMPNWLVRAHDDSDADQNGANVGKTMINTIFTTIWDFFSPIKMVIWFMTLFCPHDFKFRNLHHDIHGLSLGGGLKRHPWHICNFLDEIDMLHASVHIICAYILWFAQPPAESDRRTQSWVNMKSCMFHSLFLRLVYFFAKFYAPASLEAANVPDSSTSDVNSTAVATWVPDIASAFFLPLCCVWLWWHVLVPFHSNCEMFIETWWLCGSLR